MGALFRNSNGSRHKSFQKQPFLYCFWVYICRNVSDITPHLSWIIHRILGVYVSDYADTFYNLYPFNYEYQITPGQLSVFYMGCYKSSAFPNVYSITQSPLFPSAVASCACGYGSKTRTLLRW